MSKLTRCAAIAAALSMPLAAHADWSIVGLGTLGAEISAATSINEHGQITGYTISQLGRHYDVFITDVDGANMRLLDTPDPAAYSIVLPQFINNSGQIAGYYYNQAREIVAFYTGKNGEDIKNVEIPALSTAHGINDHGQIAVNSRGEAFIVDSIDGTTTDLGSLKGLTTTAISINNSGQVTGYSEVKSKPPFSSERTEVHAFITEKDGAGMKDIGTLGGENSIGLDVNNKGQVAGASNVRGWLHMNAFVTDENGDMINLGTFGGHDSIANSINDHGEVIGSSFTGNGSNEDIHSFLYSHGGITDLSILDVVLNAGWTFLDAMDINNHGQIVGQGTLNGITQGFLLSYTSNTKFNPEPIFIPTSPIPEPTTWTMLLAGLGLLGFIARRKDIEYK